MINGSNYDWAQAAMDLFRSNSTDINELAFAAQLDPRAGDLADADFSGVDLANQNLSGWDLSSANLRGANLAKTNLFGAKLNYYTLTEAKNWEDAIYQDHDRAKASLSAKMKEPIPMAPLGFRLHRVLQQAEIYLVGDLANIKAIDLLRLLQFGERSLKRIKSLLGSYDLRLDMKIDFWPQERIYRIYSSPNYVSDYRPRVARQTLSPDLD